MMPVVLRYLKMLGGFVLLWVGIFFWNAYSCQKVESREMEPTLKAESRKWIEPKVRSTEDLKHDDLISFSYNQPGKSQTAYAARIIGLPGDRVEMKQGDVYVNGNKINATYVGPNNKGDPRLDNYAEIIVPRDTVYVLCDSRRSFDKSDSRAIGPVGVWAINGRFK